MKQQVIQNHYPWWIIIVSNIIPDMLVTIIPLITGIVLLILQFNLILLLAVIGLVILGFPGNAMVRGQMACKYCKQGEIGCPALELFSKEKDQNSNLANKA